MGDAREKNIRKDSSRGAAIPHLTLGMCMSIYEERAADPERRAAAIRGLAELAGKGQDISAALPVLVSALSDQDEVVRSLSSRALLRLSVNGDISAAVPALESLIGRTLSAPTTTNAESVALNCAVPSLVRHFLKTNQFEKAGRYLERAPMVSDMLKESPRGYAGISQEADDFIKRALWKVVSTNQNPEVVYHFNDALVFMCIETRDWARLRDILGSDKTVIRNSALESVGHRLRNQEAAAAAMQVLARSVSDPATRDHAVDLAEIIFKKYPRVANSGSLVEPLGNVVADLGADLGERRKAAFCLQSLSFGAANLVAAIPSLERAIHDKDAYVRTNSAVALANARIDARSWSVLEELASGRNPTVKPEVRKAILETLVNAGNTGKDISPLRRMLQDIGQNDKDASIRKIANDALVSMKPETVKR